MGIKENVIDQAVEKAIEETDLEPGEVNENIKKVMATMDESYRQFEQIKQHLMQVNESAKKLDQHSQEMAEAGVELAKASQSIGEQLGELNETSDEMKENIGELKDVLDRFEEHLPEEE